MSRNDAGRRQSLLGNIQSNLGTMLKFGWVPGPGSPGAATAAANKQLGASPSIDSQVTPRAETANPFDAVAATGPTGTLQPKNGSGGNTPLGYSPGSMGVMPIAFPTTQLSLNPPNFNLQPVPNRKSPQPSTTSSPSPTKSPSPPNGTMQQQTTSNNNGKVSTHSPRGQLHVKLIQARGLAVKSALSRPYVVVVYEQNEFISREATHEDEKEVKGRPTALSRQGSSVNISVPTSSAISVLGGIQKAFDIKPRRSPSPPNTTTTTTPTNGQPSRSSGDGPEEVTISSSRSSSGSSGGSKVLKNQLAPQSIHNATNPSWKHQVSFDVTSERSVLSLNIYDRKYDGVDGFLGAIEIKPALNPDRPVDVWHKLESHGTVDASHPITGEIRVQITYEQYQNKRSLTPRDFEILKLVGKGTFGRVFQVRKKDTRRIYAMKVLSKKEIVAKKEVAHTIGERKILQRSLDSPFLVGLKFSFQTETELFLVTDFKSGGELFWHLQRETRFTEERARFYIAELTLALEHLHKHDIVYRDLKPENILLDATGHVALCDFGLSKPDLPANQLTNTFCGTTEYLAPEILLDDLGYSKMVDFWSLGVLLFEMLCGWSPFYNEDTQVMYRNICYGKIKFPRNTVSEDGKLFVKGLLNRVPANRLGSKGDAAELKAHPFFSCIDWAALLRKEVTPPFKPSVESDESTANFDPEFTSADLRDVGVDYWEEDEAMLVDSQSGQRLYNGPAGSQRMSSQGPAAPEGSIDVLTPIGSYQSPTTTTAPTAVRQVRKRRSSSPISRSLQENFRGFSYTASESVDDGWSELRERAKEEEKARGRGEAVSSQEILVVTDSPKPINSTLDGAFGEASEAMKQMNLGSRY